MKKAPSIFISYCREDSEHAELLFKQLSKSGLSPWLDTVNILPGSNWEVSINNAIEKSDFLIALLSKNSINKRGYVNKELRLALDVVNSLPDSEIYLIPLRLDECPMPLDQMRSIQRLDAFPDWDLAIKKILKVISTSYSEIFDGEVPDSVDNEIDSLASQVEVQKKIIEHLQLSNIWRNIVGDEDFFSTNFSFLAHKLSFLDQPETSFTQDNKIPQPAFPSELERIIQGIRDGKITEQYENTSAENPIKEELMFILPHLKNLKVCFPTHLDALIEAIHNAEFKPPQIQGYFYKQKKNSGDEDVNDKIVNMVLVFMMFYSVKRWTNAGEKIEDVIDNIVEGIPISPWDR